MLRKVESPLSFQAMLRIWNHLSTACEKVLLQEIQVAPASAESGMQRSPSAFVFDFYPRKIFMPRILNIFTIIFPTAFYVDSRTKRQIPTFYVVWFIGSVLMGIIILPWYIYFVFRRSRIQKEATKKIKYTLLDVGLYWHFY